MGRNTKVGKRNAAADLERIQQAHNLMAELGAACPTPGDTTAEEDAAAAGEGKSTKQMSLDEQVAEVTEEIMEALAGGMGGMLNNYGQWNEDAPCVCAVYPDYAIVRIDDQHYKAPYTVDAATDEVTVAPFNEWQPVEQAWVAKMKAMKTQGSATAVAYGQEVKALGNGKIGGYLVLFSTDAAPDLTGDFFTRETDFGPHKSSIALYQHGMDETLGRRVLDPAATMEVKDAGVWIEAQLALRDEYEQALYKLAEKGKLGWSSGTAAHLVERERVGKAYKITRWPLGLDASLTPTPAEPRTQATPLKALMTEVVNPCAGVGPNISITEEKAMPENVQPAPDANAGKMDALEAQMKDLSTAVNSILGYIQDAPAIRKAGYVTMDGGKGDANVKSFGDYLLAVARNDVQRLATVYKSVEMKDLTEGTGNQGGYLVPTEYSDTLLQVSATDSQIVSRVRRIPVRVESGFFPSLDQYTAPTAGAGNSALASGVTAANTAEGGTLTETQATFKQLAWRVHKVGGFTEVSNELINDSPQSIEALLTALFRVAIAARNERNILRGTGVGEPLGILNAPCTVGVTTNTNDVFKYVDALGMLARFKSVGGAPVWIIHPSVWPDIGQFEVSTGSGATFIANMRDGFPTQNLLGYPIIVSEHMPQANGDDVILADLSAYLLFDREALTVAFSEHAAFTADKGTWRFTQRMDGMPWLTAPITLADPTGSYTVSTFVYHDD